MELHRIEVPEELGGGWVDIKARRSWRTSIQNSAAGIRVRDGVSAQELQAAQAAGRLSDVLEIDAYSKLAAPLIAAVVGTSDGLLPAGMTVPEWLGSDELDEGLGDFLLQSIDGYYTARMRSPANRLA